MKQLVLKIVNKLYTPLYMRLQHIVALNRDSRNYLSTQNTIGISLARAAATIALRNVDESNPISWEFSGFSQNGEDGIMDFLWTKLNSKNRYFVEIGAGNGIENNTAWFSHARKFSGIMIDGNSAAMEVAKNHCTFFTHAECMFINEENIINLKKGLTHLNPDIFSLDIDGNDYYVAKSILKNNIKPKIFIVEYNSAYGPDESLTIEYDSEFSIDKGHPTHLYYGVSITGWKTFFESHGYKFITVDSNGVNAVFVDKSEFDPLFLNNIKGLNFAENFYQLDKFKVTWEKQKEMIRDKKTVKING